LASKDKKSPAKKATIVSKVTRIKASDNAPIVKTVKSPKKATPTQPMTEKKSKNPFRAIGAYFAGAWYELRQVRWPNRKATWSLTMAMLVFTGFFVVLILLLDALFKYLFEIILG
jgi:preprotein translocase SecE subunit